MVTSFYSSEKSIQANLWAVVTNWFLGTNSGCQFQLPPMYIWQKSMVLTILPASIRIIHMYCNMAIKSVALGHFFLRTRQNRVFLVHWLIYQTETDICPLICGILFCSHSHRRHDCHSDCILFYSNKIPLGTRVQCFHFYSFLPWNLERCSI